MLLQAGKDKYYSIFRTIIPWDIAFPLSKLSFFTLAAFSPGSSCKLSNQYIIQDHMAAHFKKLMSAEGVYSL